MANELHNVGAGHLRKLAEQGLRMKDSLARHREKAEEVAGRVLGTAETLAGAAISGYGSGKFPSLRVLSAPPDVAGGALLAGLAAFGVFGKYDEHMHNVGDGLLAGATARYFAGLGAKSRGAGGTSVQGGIFAGDFTRRISAAEQRAVDATRPTFTTEGAAVPSTGRAA